MAESMTPPMRRSAYATARMIVVSAVLVILLVVFGVSRFTRPPAETETASNGAEGSVVAVDPRSGLSTTFIGIGKGAAGSGGAEPASGAGSAGAGSGAAGAAPAAGDTSYTGTSHPDDLVLARQLLMDGNETAMGPIDRAAGGEDVPLQTLKDNVYQVYINLTVAPHLFPVETRPVVGPDGSTTPSTAASTAIWADFDAFYAEAMDAANLAYDMSQAADIGKFRDQAKTLRNDCDACHAKNMNVFDPTASK